MASVWLALLRSVAKNTWLAVALRCSEESREEEEGKEAEEEEEELDPSCWKALCYL